MRRTNARTAACRVFAVAIGLGLLLADAAAWADRIPVLPERPAPGALSPAGSPLTTGWIARRRVTRKAPPRRRKARPAPKSQKAPEPAPQAAPEAGNKKEDLIPMGAGGRARVDFDAQLIKGQTTKAGEVQILERKDSELKSLVKRRTSYRDEIIQTVFPEKSGTL